MVLRAIIVRSLARPLLLPLFTAGVGFWFGTFDISHRITSAVISSPNPKNLPPIYRLVTYGGGLAIGSSIFVVRHKIMTPPVSFLTNPMSDGKLSVGNFLSRIKTSFNIMKAFPIRYYSVTIVGSAILTGISSAILQKNVDVGNVVKKFDHVVPKRMLDAPTQPK